MLKIYFANINTAPNFEQKWQKMGQTNLPRNLGNAWQQWLQCIQGGGCRSITTHIHLNSGMHAC